MEFDMAQIVQELGQTLAASGTKVQITWLAWPAGTTVDAVTQSQVGPTVDGEVQGPAVQRQVARAMVHFPEPGANSSVRQFQEVEIGDCIMDFGQDVSLDGKTGLSFLILDPEGNPLDGQVWVPKPTGERLARTWGAVVQGVKIWRRVLLRKAT